MNYKHQNSRTDPAQILWRPHITQVRFMVAKNYKNLCPKVFLTNFENGEKNCEICKCYFSFSFILYKKKMLTVLATIKSRMAEKWQFN